MTILEIFSESRKLVDANSTSYSDTDLLRRVNSAIEILVGKIIQVCRNFPFDDENFANIAEGTITLQEGISKYTITDRFLTVLEVKVKDADGNLNFLDPVTQDEDTEVVEIAEAQTGLPTKYRMVGRTIFLRKAPTAGDVTLTAGLLFKYTRTSYQIDSDDVSSGTLVIGIATPWHITIAKMSALPYAKTYKKDLVRQLENDIFVETNDCIDFYANRLKDRDNRLTVKVHSNK